VESTASPAPGSWRGRDAHRFYQLTANLRTQIACCQDALEEIGQVVPEVQGDPHRLRLLQGLARLLSELAHLEVTLGQGLPAAGLSPASAPERAAGRWHSYLAVRACAGVARDAVGPLVTAVQGVPLIQPQCALLEAAMARLQAQVTELRAFLLGARPARTRGGRARRRLLRHVGGGRP
jgi:hypothetical protein